MQKLLFLVVFLVSITSVMAQPGLIPPRFIIDYSDPLPHSYLHNQGLSKGLLINNYHLRTGVFEKGDAIRFSGKPMSKAHILYHERYQGEGKDRRKIASAELYIKNALKFTGYIPKGSLIGLSIEHKKTMQVMNIYIRLGENLSAHMSNEMKIYGLIFDEGDFLYDLCDCKYAGKQSYERIVFLGNRQRNTIKQDELQQLLDNTDCSSKRFLIDLSISETKKEILLKNYDVLAARPENPRWEYHYKRKEYSNTSFLEWAMKRHPHLAKFPYAPLNRDRSIIGISFINDQKQAMNLYFKIYKRYEDYNRNEITLTHFKFVEGNFFCDMENYPVDDCSKPRFIDEFDLIQVTKYAISKQKLEQILKDK